MCIWYKKKAKEARYFADLTWFIKQEASSTHSTFLCQSNNGTHSMKLAVAQNKTKLMVSEARMSSSSNSFLLCWQNASKNQLLTNWHFLQS